MAKVFKRNLSVQMVKLNFLDISSVALLDKSE